MNHLWAFLCQPGKELGKWKHECIRHSDDVREYRLTNVDPPLNRFDHFLIVGLGLNLGLLFQGSDLAFLHYAALLLVPLVTLRLWWAWQSVQEESLLVMRDLGVQVGTRYYSGRERKVFIERQRIESIIINEGIQTWAIFYYMAILVKGQERMVLPFEHVFPRLHVILPVYKATRALLFGEPSEDEDEGNNHHQQQQ